MRPIKALLTSISAKSINATIALIYFTSISATSVSAGQIQSFNSEAPTAQSADIGGCPIFPNDNFWNIPIAALPVHPMSNAWINSIGSNQGFHMDFGSGLWDGGAIGIPYNTVSGSSTTAYTVDFYYPDESDPGPYPIPSAPNIEYGGDHHILVVDTDDCTLYEIYDASYADGQWSGGSGAIWNLNSNNLRPYDWTSADAAGLPILPGLARYEEVLAGEINHALRFTTNCTANYYIWPARHIAPSGNCANPVPFGARFRLKASYNISGFSPQAQVILQAMKTYGIVLADNGSPWYVSGSPNAGWDNDVLHEIDVVKGSDFEVVDTSSLTPWLFKDVTDLNPARNYIESIYHAGITGGRATNPLYYCPNSAVTRAQMAVFLMRGIRGASYSPPTATGTMFNDISTGSFAAAFIEAFSTEGITTGCGGGNFCPNGLVTRAQMAVFLLRAEHGAGYTPPAATGTMFTDAPTSHPFTAWIEQLANEGVTSGCGGGNFCPNNPVTRAQMAVFIQRVFNLPMP